MEYNHTIHNFHRCSWLVKMMKVIIFIMMILKTVYQFNGQNYRIANEINLIDRYTKEYPNLNLIKEAMVKLANSQDDEEILEFYMRINLLVIRPTKINKEIKKGE